MNLLEKYKSMLSPSPPLSLVVDNKANTEEREKSQKKLFIEATSNIRNIPPVVDVEVNTPIPPEIIQLEPIVEAAWVNPHARGTPEAREKSLLAVMEAIWTKEFQGIINKVLNRKAQIADFQKAVEAWGRMVKVG